MNSKLILPAALFVLLAACNSSSGDKEKKEDSTANNMNHDSMDHGNMDHTKMTSGTVPALPSIPDGAKVFFKNLKNGATITSPFKLQMGAEVMKVDTANLVAPGSGHHHLFIDAEDSLASGTIVPKDSAHVHFGKAQTEYELTLSPGKHKLTLQMADGLHRSYGGKLSATIMVNVKK